VVQHDGLRNAVRNAVQAASAGQTADIDFAAISCNLSPQGFAHGWQAVTCVENHDIVKVGTNQRIPALAHFPQLAVENRENSALFFVKP
jgi:hypothetical protein